ncbi:MAG: CBS domain-containing protein [Alphaproteobacteria bacterium]|nr:CBS domain-containing protein [Alphaproteobacteria bacterium]
MLYRHVTSPAVSIPSGAPIGLVAKTLEACEGRQVPVMHDGHPMGVVRQEDLDDQGTLRAGSWFGWGSAKTARDVTSEAPILRTDLLGEAMRALLQDTVVVVCAGDGSLVGVLTEHDGVRAALDHLPDGVPARAVASTPVHSVSIDEDACHADQHMRLAHVRHVVVTDGGRAVGVVSHRDLVSEGIRRGRSLPLAAVWRRRPLLSVPADAPLIDAANLLVDQRVGAVPLLDAEGRAVAVLTRRDVVKAAIDHAWAD